MKEARIGIGGDQALKTHHEAPNVGQPRERPLDDPPPAPPQRPPILIARGKFRNIGSGLAVSHSCSRLHPMARPLRIEFPVRCSMSLL
jgi:hypothetical protein